MRGLRRSVKAAVAAAACIMAVTAVAETAQAARFGRNECFVRNSAGQRGRQMGVRNAQRLFDSVWKRLGRECSNLDRLVSVLADTPLSPPTSRGAMQGCFYQGYTDTLFDNLELASERCSDRCFEAGSEIGQISAQGYCAASMALGGLDDPGFIEQPALPLCGFNVVIGCKSQYIQTATYDVRGCRDFTEGAFYETFDNMVRQDCFVPSDVPIRDGFAAYLDLNASTMAF